MYYYLHLSLNLINVEQFSHSGSTFGHLDTRRQILEVSITLHSVITRFHVKYPLECLRHFTYEISSV